MSQSEYNSVVLVNEFTNDLRANRDLRTIGGFFNSNDHLLQFFRLLDRKYPDTHFYYLHPMYCVLKKAGLYYWLNNIKTARTDRLRQRLQKMHKTILTLSARQKRFTDEKDLIRSEKLLFVDWQNNIDKEDFEVVGDPLESIILNYDLKLCRWSNYLAITQREMIYLQNLWDQTSDELKRRLTKHLDVATRKSLPDLFIPMDVMNIIVDYGYF